MKFRSFTENRACNLSRVNFGKTVKFSKEIFLTINDTHYKTNWRTFRIEFIIRFHKTNSAIQSNAVKITWIIMIVIKLTKPGMNGIILV